eukprot:GHVL01009081.1.p1 GENE.GHVL01009081.1~~GHVL01009081.1.p1  ORF type:complete len:779 (+),score=92.84 GHVL01009081.1:128-2464(+)
MAQVAPPRKDSTRDVEKLIARCPKVIEDRTNRPDAHLRKFSRGKMLGKGGFAVCFEATHLSTNKLYAVKVVDKQSIQKSRAREKLKSEIIIHRALNHSRIVKFESYFDDENFVYIILEICPNQTLNDMIRARKCISEPEAKFYVLQLVNAIKYLHKERVIHRDLKLGNLFIDEAMNLKVGDFGLAARLNSDCEQKRTICGTPNYIAPEVLRNKGHSLEVDVWSLGVIMYTMLIGRPPFETKNVQDTYKRIESNQYQYPAQCRVSAEGRSLINGMLQVNPADRFALDKILDHPWLAPSSIPEFLPKSALKVAPSLDELRMNKTAPLQSSSWKANQLPAPVVLNQFEKTKPTTSPRCWGQNGGLVEKEDTAPSHNARRVETNSNTRLLSPSSRLPTTTPDRGVLYSTSTLGAENTERRDRRYISSTNKKTALTEFCVSSKKCPDYGNDFENCAKPVMKSCPSAPVLAHTVASLELKHTAMLPSSNQPAAARTSSLRAFRSSSLRPSRSDDSVIDCVSEKQPVLLGRGGPCVSTVLNENAEKDSCTRSRTATRGEKQHSRSVSRPAAPLNEEMKKADDCGPLPQIPWISQWIDFSSRYGLGYRLCDGSIGVYFNDATRIVAPASAMSAEDGGKEQWCEFIGRQKDANGTRFDVRTRIPLNGTSQNKEEWTTEFKKKITLMRNFKHFMATGQYKDCCIPGKSSFPSIDEVDDAACIPACLPPDVSPPSCVEQVLSSDEPVPVHLKKWLSTSTSVAFQLSNRWVQVYFIVVKKCHRSYPKYTD